MKEISLRGNIWKIKSVTKHDEGYKEIIDELLRIRGVKSTKDKERFFDPPDINSLTIKDFNLQHLDFKALYNRLKFASENKEKVVVYGDYDADGICATAIMWEALHDIGIDASPFIPSRFKEGYGFNVKGLSRVIEEHNPKLIITVDNGIVAFEATTAARSRGIDVIITDHHNKISKIPNANIIVHTTKTSGAGISYLVSSYLRNKFNLKNTRNGLDLCAIGVVSDQVSVKHPNRSLIKFGIQELNNSKRPGLIAIYEQAGITKTPIGVFEIGYTIAPRLNASGRLYDGMDSLRLLCTTNKSRATTLSHKLGGYNKERQEIVNDVLVEAEKIAKKTNWKGSVVVSSPNFHEGVIGLAASKLAETYGRPAIVISIGGTESKASGRSIEGFDLIGEIHKVGKYLISAGGHPGAVGFTIKTKDIKKFAKDFEDVSSKKLGDKLLTKSLVIDTEINFTHINTNLLYKLKKFEPTGIDSKKPLFVTRGVEIVSYKLVGSDYKHMKLILRKDGKTFDAIAFSFGAYFREIAKADLVDVSYHVEENIWNGVSSIDLRISDIRV